MRWDKLVKCFSLCFPCFEGQEIFIHWKLNLHESEYIKQLHDVKCCNEIVFLFFSFLIYHYKIISCTYSRFCFVETNTVCKSDCMSIPIWSDYTRTIELYEYTPYGPDHTGTV